MSSKLIVGRALVSQGGGGILKFPEGFWLMFSPRGTEPQFPPASPGTVDGDVGGEAHWLFREIDSQLSDAQLALKFFKKAEDEEPPVGDVTSFRDRHQWLRAVSDRVWRVNQIARMHARSFVSSAEMTLKLLKQLKTVAKGYDLENAIKRVEERLAEEIPHLANLRNSIQHTDERIRGRAKLPGQAVRQIVPEPIDTPKYEGPQIHVGILDGDVFRYTAEDGSHSEVSISDTTLASLIQCMQRVMNDGPWYRSKFGAGGSSGHPGWIRFKAVE